MGDLALRTQLGVDLLLPVLASRLGTAIPGCLQGGLLYTHAHLTRIKARLPCCRHACTHALIPPDCQTVATIEASLAGRSLTTLSDANRKTRCLPAWELS